VRIVLNRVSADSDITLKKAEETIGKPIFWQFPNDTKLMMDSRNHGIPLVLHAPKSKLQQSFVSLAGAIGGTEVEAPVKEKAGRWALFARR
jgi:pilus assembly protein CpaE